MITNEENFGMEASLGSFWSVKVTFKAWPKEQMCRLVSRQFYTFKCHGWNFILDKSAIFHFAITGQCNWAEWNFWYDSRTTSPTFVAKPLRCKLLWTIFDDTVCRLSTRINQTKTGYCIPKWSILPDTFCRPNKRKKVIFWETTFIEVV